MCDLIHKIQYLYDRNGNISATRTRFLPIKNPELFQLIINRTSFLTSNASIRERLYLIKNDLNKKPKCECGLDLKYIPREKRYSIVCSSSCKYFIKSKLERSKVGVLLKYGVENVFSLDIVKEKIRRTVNDRYGVSHALQSPKFKDKARRTLEDRFGSIGIGHPEIQEKFRSTCLRKYGVTNPSKDKDIKLKKQITTNKNYGVDNPFQSETIKESIKNNNLIKLGTSYRSREHLKSKIKIFIENEEKLKKWLINMNHKKKVNLVCISSFLGLTDSTVGKYFRKFNIEIKYHRKYSSLENSINNYIKSIAIGSSIERNYRNFGIEFDFYLPYQKIVIESHGLFWHSYSNMNSDSYGRNLHLNKYKVANKNGLKLFQIFENEWNDTSKQEIWKSLLRYAINPTSITKLHARKCEIKEVSKSVGQLFLEKNHLQGDFASTSLYIGLFYKDQLVSVMSFCKSRFNSKFEWEIARYATILNTSIMGGATKLFSYFLKLKDPQSVITYSDLRYSNGNVYKLLGFSLTRATKPNYFYFSFDFNRKNTKLFSRVSFQKHKLSKKLENYNPDLSESENMFANGYRRIWDCGNNVFEYRKIV